MSALLFTKFFPPTLRQTQVPRARILEMLERGLLQGRLLTLVSAPAGYGKSVAVAEWLAHQQSPIENHLPQTAWLSLEEADNQPNRFFTYFLAALRQCDESFCPELFATLQAGQTPPTELLVTTLVNAMLDWQARHILALDDFHHIQDKTILNVLTNLLAHAPPNFHLALMTREDPPLPLARLRAQGQLTEIRAADLRFSEVESGQLLRDGLGLELSAAEVTHLTERTEGWVAGLQLAGVSLRGRENPGAFVQTLSGSHRFILDYLTDEVLQNQPPEVQDFLLKTSILQRLSGDLCNAVTGRADSADLLERLLAANLFIIPLDDQSRWYRYHHLFAELLQHRLKRERADCLPDLHRLASLWHEAQGMVIESIEHARASGDETRWIRLLEKYAWRLLTRGYSRLLLEWVEIIPKARRSDSPRLSATAAWGKILHGEYAGTKPYLAEAQSAVKTLPPESAEARALQTDLLALQSFVSSAQGKMDESLTLAERSWAMAPRDDVRLMASTALALGTAYRLSGRFREAIDMLEEALRAAQTIDDHVTSMVAMAHLSLIWHSLGRLRLLAERAGAVIERAETISRVAPAMLGSVYAALGQVYYEWNQVDEGREAIQHGIRLAALSEQPASLIYGNIHLARLYRGLGNSQAAEACLSAAGETLAKGGPGWARLDWMAERANLLITQGSLAEAETILQSAGIAAESPVTYRTDAIHLAWLRWMLASRRPDALPLAERIVHSAEAEGRNGTLIYALTLGARAGGGADWLARARHIGEPEGYLRVFLDEAADEQPPTSPDLIEQLTGREWEVLRLMTEGLTYAQMAERLVVSVNTVRYHVKSVYAKLGVEKQTQAIERGRRLGLL